MIKYVSDLIQIEEIESWNNGDVVLINAPTGTGKNYFVFQDLNRYCTLHGKEILLLSNRNVLKAQHEKEILGNSDLITVMNYQKLEFNLMNDLEIPHYDYIIADECHYCFVDAAFNRRTDLTLKWLLRQTHSITILMTATGESIEDYLYFFNINANEYSIREDYSYIERFYFYKNDNVLKKLLQNLPNNEKVLYFASALKAFNVSKDFNNSSFICSGNNSFYSKYSNQGEIKNIIEKDRFESQILCTTIVLDNGINIKDPQVLHIIVDYFDPDVLQQCVGRLRIDKDQQIRVYIRDRNKKSLYITKRNYLTKLEQAQYFDENGEADFVRKYGKSILSELLDLTYEDGNIRIQKNEVMFMKFQDVVKKCNELIPMNNGYRWEVRCRFKQKSQDVFILDDEIDAITLKNKINGLVGLEMYQEQQKDFKAFLLGELINSPKMNHGPLGLKTINSLFQELGLDFKLVSKRQKSRRSPNRDKTYWMIIAA